MEGTDRQSWKQKASLRGGYLGGGRGQHAARNVGECGGVSEHAILGVEGEDGGLPWRRFDYNLGITPPKFHPEELSYVPEHSQPSAVHR
jgi:hypothetical protein